MVLGKERGEIMSGRKYIIESRRYIDENGNQKFDSWITNANVIEVKHEEQYLVFFPLEGEFAGKKHYIPFSNIHIVREL
jgi:hypothetical protein